MGTNRRDFLKLITAGTCGAAIHNTLSPATGFLAYADPLNIAGVADRVFVLFNFSGGVSYNLCPVYHGTYRDRNRNISYGPENSIPINGEQGVHPSLTALQPIISEGRLAVLNLIGAGPYHSRSHDEATIQWHVQKSSSTGAQEGWGARLSSQLQSAFGGVSLSGSNSLVRGGTNPPRVISSLSSLGETPILWDNDDALQLQMVRTNLVAQSPAAQNAAEEHVRASTLKLQSNIELLRQYANMALPVVFPNTGLGGKFRDAARLIAAGPALGVKFIYIEQGGYDTHSDERNRLTQNLNEFNGALNAFILCMKSLGRWNDVVIANMSEFTRTMENSSFGTDHGLAGPQMVLGGLVKGGIKTSVPTAQEIGTNEFIRASRGTFAQVFAEIVYEFLGFDPNLVFNGDIAASPYFDVI